MQTTPDEYILSLPLKNRHTIENLRQSIQRNLPAGFSEIITYGMISYVNPFTLS